MTVNNKNIKAEHSGVLADRWLLKLTTHKFASIGFLKIENLVIFKKKYFFSVEMFRFQTIETDK